MRCRVFSTAGIRLPIRFQPKGVKSENCCLSGRHSRPVRADVSCAKQRDAVWPARCRPDLHHQSERPPQHPGNDQSDPGRPVGTARSRRPWRRLERHPDPGKRLHLADRHACAGRPRIRQAGIRGPREQPIWFSHIRQAVHQHLRLSRTAFADRNHCGRHAVRPSVRQRQPQWIAAGGQFRQIHEPALPRLARERHVRILQRKPGTLPTIAPTVSPRRISTAA